MTVKDQVQDSFYENVRVAFDDFIQEIENYNNAIKKAAKKSPKKCPSTCSSKKSKTSIKELKIEEKIITPKPQTKVFLGSSIDMVDRINVRLQHLIDMLSRFNLSHCHVPDYKYTGKKSEENSKSGSNGKEKTVDEVVNHTIKKLKKYSKKHGISSLKKKNPRTTSLKKTDTSCHSDGCTMSQKSLKRQAVNLSKNRK